MSSVVDKKNVGFQAKAMVKYLHSGCLPYQGGASFVDPVCYF